MSMKDLLSKMTELQGTVESVKTVPVAATGKKLLNESSNTMKESTKPSLKSIFSSLLSEAENYTTRPAADGKTTDIINQKGHRVATTATTDVNRTVGDLKSGKLSVPGTTSNQQAQPNQKMNEVDDDMAEGLDPELKQKYAGKTKAELLKRYDALKAGDHDWNSPEGAEIRDLFKVIRNYSLWNKFIDSKLGQKIGKLIDPNSTGAQINTSGGKSQSGATWAKGLVTPGGPLGPIARVQRFNDKYKNFPKNEGVDEIDSAEYEADVYDGDDYDDDDGSDQYATELNGLHIGDVVKAYYNGKAVIGKINELYPTNMEVELELTGRNTGKTIVVDVRDIDVDNLNESKLTEKAVSKSQQQAAGAALAAKRGDTSKSKLTGASKEMAKMPAKELEKFAKTKHKGLPDKKKTDESSSVSQLMANLRVRIVHNKLLGGWFIVRGPHQTPISGKFSSKEEAEKSLKQKEKPTANEAAMPTHDGDFGAGLGAGRNSKTLESKKSKPDFLDKDGNKKESMKKAAADKQKVSTMKKTNDVKKTGKLRESIDVELGTPEHKVIMDLISGNLDAYDVMNHPRTPAQKNVADMMQDRYDDIATEYPLHADDDFEDILYKLVDELADDYDTPGYSQSMNEAKKAKPDFLDIDGDGDEKESMKKAAADKKKTGSADKKSSAGLTAAQKKLPAGLQKAVAKKKTVKEGANPTEAARLLGKAHAMGKDPFACKYEEGSSEAQAYLDGYKEGLDECYGSGGGMGMQQDIGMMPGMDSMVSMNDTPSLRGGSDFEVDSMDDMGSFGGFDGQSDEFMEANSDWDAEFDAKPKDWKPTPNQAFDASKRALGIANRLPKDQRDKWNSRTMSQMNKFRVGKTEDMMAFEAWDRQLNELLNEGKMNIGIGDQVIIDPRKKLGYASSGKSGKIEKIYTDSEGEVVAVINVGPSIGTQTKMNMKGGMFGPQGMELDLGRGVNSGGSKTVVPLSYLEKLSMNEGKMKDIDIDMKQMSDAEFKKEHGKSKADMKKDLSSDSKKPVKEGISVSVSKGQQGAPDSVSVTAQDSDADALLAMIKQAGLGLFGGDEPSGYGSPASAATQPTGDVGDHDSMMALIKKMSSTGNDYEDEESMSCDSCDDESDSKALVVGEEQGYDDKEDESLGMRTGKESDKEQSMKDRRDDSYGKFGKRTDEDETEDQMEFEVAESNAPDSDEAETTADENAEAKEDQALAGAMSGDEEEIDEGSCSMDEEEELTEWANDAGYTGSENTKDNTFEQDIEFMTRVISGGLNGPKKDQTTLPHTRVKVDESKQAINDWKKLSGIK